MSVIVDNLLAYRILKLLIIPFEETPAFKLGIIDINGKNLIKSKDFTSGEQRKAYTYLHRLIFNIKKIINKVGGESKLKYLASALFLVKEAYINNYTDDYQHLENKYINIINLVKEGRSFDGEEQLVKKFLNDDAPANHSGAGVSTDQPVIKRKDKKKKKKLNMRTFINNNKNKNKYWLKTGEED